MSERLFTLYVEGIADKVFFKQYLQHCFGIVMPEERIVNLEGWTNIKGISALRRMRSTTDNGGVNIAILDADKDIDARRKDILDWKQEHDVEFELFLLPNNQDAGALEDLLEHIINPNNQPIFDCWQHYEDELVQQEIPGRTPPPLTTPAKKTKIYGYLEALLGTTKREKELIKDPNRNYENPQHWNLNAEYLEPLKLFLNDNLL
ncbi:MAG: DUF3226 domain-containing protein [Bacteroidales bacterium]|nr:DUF3226 domain-containing protein [Bacteroidales bacterium]